jgi:hypothetical protein
MIKKGELPHVSIGRRKLVDIQDLDEWIEKHKEGGNGQSLQTEELENLVVKFYVNGRAIRESTGTESETEADKILKLHEGQGA